MLAINEVLQKGRYRITHQFGHDETGAGYEAYDNVLESNVVVKELNKRASAAREENTETDFAGEAKILAKIRHDSILHVHDYFSDDDRQFLVMESVKGNDLGELLGKNAGAFELMDVADWADQLLDALNCLHTQEPPIFHRHIKPQNLKLTSTGKIKLLVFGTDKSSEETGKNQNFDSASLHYLPLEQIWAGLDTASQKVITNSYDERSEKILRQPADARSDIYALGATLYHLLTARLPVDALERSIEILDGKSDPLPTPHQINPLIPAEISDILVKAMELKRENRFDSAVIMRHVFRTAVRRAQERQVEEAKKQEEAAQQVRLAKQERLEQERKVAEELKRKIQERQQAELLEIQTSKAANFQAGNLAGAGENQTFELEIQDLLDGEPTPSVSKSTEKNAPISTPFTEVQPEPIEQPIARQNIAVEEKELFTQAEPPKKKWLMIPAVLLALIILGGAGFWFSQTPKTVEPSNAIPLQQNQVTEKSVTETAPVPTAETSTPPAVSTEPTMDVNETSTTGAQTSVKTKSVQPSAPKIEKRAASPVKAQPKEKKAVTVDDIINDN